MTLLASPKYGSQAAQDAYAAHPGQKVTTTDTGYFRAGFEAKIIAAGERIVFLGAECIRTTVAEFTLLFPSGTRREFCEAGKDFTITA